METQNLSVPVKQGDSYEVIVCGGGTAGCIAAIAAARAGAKTLLVERTFTVGGMLTLGNAGITKYIEHCRDVEIYKHEVLDVLQTDPRSVQIAGGLAREFADRLIASGGGLGTHGQAGSYVFPDRYAAQFLLIDMLEEAGVAVLYDTCVVDVKLHGCAINGVIVHNKEGFTQYPAQRVIDATGDADVAALAGVPFSKGVTQADLDEGCGNHLGEMMHFGSMFRVNGVSMSALFAYLKRSPQRFMVHQFGVMSLENAIQSHQAGEMSVFRVLVDDGTGQMKPVQVYNTPTEGEVILLGPGLRLLR